MEFLLPIFQAFSFYSIPLLVGRGVINLLTKRTFSYPFITYFVIGALSIYGTILAAYYAIHTLMPSIPFSTIFYAVLITLGIVGLIGNFYRPRHDISFRKYFGPVAVASFLSAAVYYLWHINSPYPFNWDIFHHQTLVNTLFQNRFSFMTSQVSDTFGFNGYSSFFHTILAVSQIGQVTALFTYWHALSMMHFFLVAMASYLLAWEATHNKAIAYLSLIIGAVIFDSSVSFTTLFFIPQTFTAVMTIFLLTQLMAEVKKGRNLPLPLIGGSAIFIFLNHYVIGTIAVGLYIAIYLYTRFRSYIVSHINRKLAIYAVLLLAGIAIAVSSFIPLGFLNNGEAADFSINFAQKYEIMRQIYGFLMLLFFPVGAYVLWKTRGELEMLILLVTLLLLALVLLQLPYMLKFYVLTRFFVHVIIAIGIFTLLRQITNKITFALSVFLLTLSLGVILITNAANWKELLRYQTIFSNVSDNEVAAAEYLKQNYSNSNILLVSDPATQHILEPLGKINTQGGAYMKTSSRKTLDAIAQTQNPEEIADHIYQIDDVLLPGAPKRIVALNGRYFLWQKSTSKNKDALSYNIWYPADLTLEDHRFISLLRENPRFTLIYLNETIALFEVQPN